MYGKYKRSFGKSSSRYTSAAPRRNRRYAMGKVARYNRKSTIAKRLNKAEIKYSDSALNFNKWTETSTTGGGIGSRTYGSMDYVLGGLITYQSDVHGLKSEIIQINGGSGLGNNGATANMGYIVAYPNCLTNVESGTTAKTRIGNIIQPRYLRMQCVLGGAKTNHPKDPETTWKDEPGTGPDPEAIERYARTSIKLYVVRDKNMNEKGYVEYDDMFERPDHINAQNGGSVSPFLWNRKVDTMGRYEVLKEKEFTLDADDPQRSFTFVIPLKGVNIKYNGSVSPQALTGGFGGYGNIGSIDGNGNFTPNITSVNTSFNIVKGQQPQSMTNGIYLLAVAHCFVGVGGTENWVSPELMFSTRMTFQD